MLNNSLETLLKLPGTLKISIIYDGRVIADSDPADINSKAFSILDKNKRELNKAVLVEQQDFIFGKKTYHLILKTDKSHGKLFRESLVLKLVITCLTFLLTILLIYYISLGHKSSAREKLTKIQNVDIFNDEYLLNSDSILMLVLSGENKILKASKKSFELFGSDIIGKNITDVSNFSLITKYFSEGKTPLVKDGNKYFII